jgi:N-methylhydantoinase A
MDPTFTDAMVVLGYLNPVALAGGRVKLDASRAREIVNERVALPLGLSLLDAAHGIYTVAAATMTRAVKAVTTYRGRDPRDFTLVAFGGNGPIAAAAVAESLSMEKVLIPKAPGVFSAVGLLLAEVEHEFTSTVMAPADALTEAAFAGSFRQLEGRALAEMKAQEHPVERVQLKRVAELRYAGQAYELPIVLEAADSLATVVERFHEEHARTYGHRSDGDPIDVVSIRIYARVLPDGVARSYVQLGSKPLNAQEVRAATVRSAYFGKALGLIRTPVLDRSDLTGEWRQGPLIVEEYDATCVVPPQGRARLDGLGNIEIDIFSETAK